MTVLAKVDGRKYHVTQEQRRLIYRLYGDEKMSMARVGLEVFGRDNAGPLVKRILREGGIEARTAKEGTSLRGVQFTEEEEKEIVRLYVEEGLGKKAIGKRFNVGHRVIDRRLRKRGVKIRSSQEGKAASPAYQNKKLPHPRVSKIEKMRRRPLKAYGKKSKFRDLPLFEHSGKELTVEQREKTNQAFRNKYRKDPQFRATHLWRKRLQKIHGPWSGRSEGLKQSTRMIEMLGCSPDCFKDYLESRFEDWMTWDNCGTEWVIDHIVPCKWFDQTNPEHVRLCWHHKNLRPLSKKFNNIKLDKPMDFDPALVAGGSCETVRALRAFAFNFLAESKAVGYC